MKRRLNFGRDILTRLAFFFEKHKTSDKTDYNFEVSLNACKKDKYELKNLSFRIMSLGILMIEHTI